MEKGSIIGLPLAIIGVFVGAVLKGADPIALVTNVPAILIVVIGSLGAALANKKYGRITVSMQCDGDLMYSPGVLWTAARHRIPILYLIHNNRAYHQEIMQLQHTAGQRSRGYEQCTIGTVITDPNIDYAKMAASMGVESFGPVEDPAQLGPAIKRGIEVATEAIAKSIREMATPIETKEETDTTPINAETKPVIEQQNVDLNVGNAKISAPEDLQQSETAAYISKQKEQNYMLMSLLKQD